MEVKFSPLADESLWKLTLYLEDNFGPKVSYRVLLAIQNYVEAIGRNPHLGMRAEEWSWRGEVRRVIYRQNSIYYLVRPDRIIIIVIWDGRQSENRLRQNINKFFGEYSSL